MRAFSYQRPTTFAEAADLLGHPDASPLGGGTDLLVCIEEGLYAPTALVDLRSVQGGDTVTADESGVRIGAAVRVQQLARDPLVSQRFPALTQACDAVGSTALRHMGTIGGNLCQRPRCWYFRRGIPCLKNGGTSCPARDGENQYHAVIDGGPCFIVHPSDPAIALTALDAELELTSREGTRSVPVSEFYLLPRDRMDHETVLRPGEVVSAVMVPARVAGARQYFRKLIHRGAWDFALVSIAAVRDGDGGVRIVLGGIAPRPWRVPLSIEEDVASGGLDEDSIGALAERALYDATPLSKNAYKVELAASLLRDAMRELAA